MPSAKTQARPLLLVERLPDLSGRAEARLAKRWVPAEHFVLGDQDVGVAVAGEIDEPEIGIAQSRSRQRRERREGLPAVVVRALVETGSRARRSRRDRVGHRRRDRGTAAGRRSGPASEGCSCDQLRAARSATATVGFRCRRHEVDRTQVALVEPAPRPAR